MGVWVSARVSSLEDASLRPEQHVQRLSEALITNPETPEP